MKGYWKVVGPGEEGFQNKIWCLLRELFNKHLYIYISVYKKKAMLGSWEWVKKKKMDLQLGILIG